jgi:hypothetical protein
LNARGVDPASAPIAGKKYLPSVYVLASSASSNSPEITVNSLNSGKFHTLLNYP